MELRNRIFAHVFDWLCQNKGVDGQKDLARRTNISENTLTNILNGKTRVSDKTLHKLNMGFNGMFNMQYLRGIDPLHMLVDDFNDQSISRVPYNEKEKAANPSEDESAAQNNVLELYAQIVRRLDDTRMELHQELAEVRTIKADLQHEREALQSLTQQLSTTLRTIRGMYIANAEPGLMAADSTTNK